MLIKYFLFNYLLVDVLIMRNEETREIVFDREDWLGGVVKVEWLQQFNEDEKKGEMGKNSYVDCKQSQHT